LLLVSYDETKL